jgi:hypothetical protein
MLLATARDRAEVEAACDALARIDPLLRPFYALVRQGALPYE